MALARTLKTSSAVATTAATVGVTTASFTPANGSLLVLCVGIQRGGSYASDVASMLAITDSAGLTWTRRVYTNNPSDDWDTAVAIYTAPVVTGVSMTVTMTTSEETSSTNWAIYEYTGQHGTPTGATASGYGIGSPFVFSLTLSAAPASSSEVITMGYNENATIPTPSGFTSLNAFSGQYMLCGTSARTGSTSSTVDFGSFTSSYGASAVALEIIAAASASKVPLFMHQYKTRRIQ